MLLKYFYVLACSLIILITGCEAPANKRPLPEQYSVSAGPGYALPVTGAHNFRDLGGYKTSDGQQLKWGLLFRSSSLSSLTDEDLVYLNRLQIMQVFDFRSAYEIEKSPDYLPQNWPGEYISLPVDPGNNSYEIIKQELALASEKDTDLSQFMINLNRNFVTNYTAVYGQWLKQLARGEKHALVFHCTAGKDRTGFAAALLLLTLGVPYDTVMNDYLLSNRYSGDYIERTTMILRAISLFQYDEAAIRSLLEVQPAYLNGAFDVIIADYGSIDAYIETGLGLDQPTQAKLRTRYLY
jgi:protein-tyrosine phosphatase